MKLKVAPLHVFLVALGCFIATVVVWTISEAYVYYRTPVKERFRSPLHPEFKPGGRIGHSLGIAGTVLLISLLSYSVRKRSKFLRGKGKLNRWLQFHIFCGVAGPVLITLHTSFKLRGIVAISYWSMIIVAISGLIGRYLYAQVPRAISGTAMEFDEMKKEVEQINAELAQLLPDDKLEALRRIADFHVDQPPTGLKAIFLMVSDDIRWLKRRSQLRGILRGAGLSTENRKKLLELARKREVRLRRLSLLKVSNDLFRHWHVLHLPLAQTMYFTMIIHIFIAIMTGYF